MNREILFRGKRVDNGEWVGGFYVKYGIKGEKRDCIIPMSAAVLYAYEVISETIGQYTGLTDKNGVEIFEGDIASFKRFENNYVGKIIFNNKTAGFEFWWNVIVGAYGEKATRCANLSVCDEIEVIGNIHDNSEMLGD